MRKLKWHELEKHASYKELNLILNVHSDPTLESIESDFEGNLFYTVIYGSYKSSKPLNICIPELKNVPSLGGSDENK